MAAGTRLPGAFPSIAGVLAVASWRRILARLLTLLTLPVLRCTSSRRVQLQEEVYEEAAQHGNVTGVHVPQPPPTVQDLQPGRCYIRYASPEDAQKGGWVGGWLAGYGAVGSGCGWSFWCWGGVWASSPAAQQASCSLETAQQAAVLLAWLLFWSNPTFGGRTLQIANRIPHAAGAAALAAFVQASLCLMAAPWTTTRSRPAL